MAEGNLDGWPVQNTLLQLILNQIIEPIDEVIAFKDRVIQLGFRNCLIIACKWFYQAMKTVFQIFCGLTGFLLIIIALAFFDGEWTFAFIWYCHKNWFTRRVAAYLFLSSVFAVASACIRYILYWLYTIKTCCVMLIAVVRAFIHHPSHIIQQVELIFEQDSDYGDDESGEPFEHIRMGENFHIPDGDVIGGLWRNKSEMQPDSSSLEGMKERDDSSKTSICVVCLAAKKQILVLPCRHLCICAQCAVTIREQTEGKRRVCPLCRSRISHTLECYV